MTIVSLNLPDEISQRLSELVTKTEYSKTFFMIKAIEEKIEDLEDLYLTEQRMLDIRSGKSKTIPLDEVMKEYGLEN